MKKTSSDTRAAIFSPINSEVRILSFANAILFSIFLNDLSAFLDNELSGINLKAFFYTFFYLHFFYTFLYILLICKINLFYKIIVLKYRSFFYFYSSYFIFLHCFLKFLHQRQIHFQNL